MRKSMGLSLRGLVQGFEWFIAAVLLLHSFMELVIQFCLRPQLKTVLHEVGGATEAFNEFIADGGKGDVLMRKLQASAEASGITGQPLVL